MKGDKVVRVASDIHDFRARFNDLLILHGPIHYLTILAKAELIRAQRYATRFMTV